MAAKNCATTAGSANFDLINRASNRGTPDRPLHETYFDTVNFRAHFKSDYDVFITPVDCNVSLPIFENVRAHFDDSSVRDTATKLRK